MLVFTAIETRAAVDPERFAVPVIFKAEAEIVAAPTDLAVAAPVLETAITAGDEVDHEADDVTSFVLPSV